MGTQAFSIHAHFYQPPREDPLTGSIPFEENAYPFPNWNERIHAECYRPNAELKNFEHISFNIGPTLYAWMRSHDPSTCDRIVAQDRANLKRHGVGNAIAQAYNHTILPLSSYRDKVTQVYWGIADFEHYFGHKPKGLWLPETAVDYETLEVLARFGIDFTVLAPWQALPLGGCPDEASTTSIDPTEPYIVILPGHKQITIFLYQGDLSARVSFDPWTTTNADQFAQQILPPYFCIEKSRHDESQLLLIATDGELYGHHHNFREHFLTRLVDGAASQLGISSTYPGLWLKHFQPRQTVEIRERTSWSCHHGVARWMGECPCTPGDGAWKGRLRHAFERLAEELDALYLEVIHPFVRDAWLLRDRYIHVMLGKIPLEDLISAMAWRSLTSDQLRRVHLTLEAQRERQRMFTSCGWFFDDFDRIEPRNGVAYAAQAVRLARLATNANLESELINDLGQVVSTKTGLRADQVFLDYFYRSEGT